MKKIALFVALLCSTVGLFGQSAENLNLKTPAKAPYNCYGRLADGCPNAEALGIKVGVQYYTFHKYTFFEAIEITKALGLHYIEATIGAIISNDCPEKIGAGLAPEYRDMIKKKLSECGVKCQSIYYWMNGNGEGFEDIVKFCKDMGWTIVTDPKREPQGGKPVSYYEEILNKYGVTMVFTNHPKAAAYWNPDLIEADTKSYGKNIGASIDFGHFMRGGFDAFEAATRFGEYGKMYHFHMRDVSEIGAHGLDVPCGKGKGRHDELFDMLADNNIHPLMMLEYEHDFDNPIPYLIKSIDYINNKCGEIIHRKESAAALGDTVVLYACDAKIEGDLRLQDSGNEATIHNWNSAEQKIVWNANLTDGNYMVQLRYSQPHTGSAISLEANGQEIASLIQPTFTWYDYQEHNIGILHVEKDGQTTLSMRGIQKSYAYNDKSEYKAIEVLPDVHWVRLVKTSLPATSQSTSIFKQKGVSIFNGKDFDGWEPNNGDETLKHFRIAGKAIVGGSMKEGLDHNEFMRTKKQYRNFQLHLKYKVKAIDDTYNGGVQIRSTPMTDSLKPYEMYGYQVDIISWKKGALYDESRRWDFNGMQLDAPSNYNAFEWNDYVIRCEGPRIRIWLNGVKTTDFIEPFTIEPFEDLGIINTYGHIAVQIHEGKPCEIWYKDIDLIDLDE